MMMIDKYRLCFFSTYLLIFLLSPLGGGELFAIRLFLFLANCTFLLYSFFKIFNECLDIIDVIGVYQFTLFSLYIAIVEIFQSMLKAIDITFIGSHHRNIKICTTEITFTFNGFMWRLLLFFAFSTLFVSDFFRRCYSSCLKNNIKKYIQISKCYQIKS